MESLPTVLIWGKLQYLWVKMFHLKSASSVPHSASHYEAKKRSHLYTVLTVFIPHLPSSWMAPLQEQERLWATRAILS